MEKRMRCFLITMVLLSCVAGTAQQGRVPPPPQAYSLADSDANADAQDLPTETPDRTPPSGAQVPTLDSSTRASNSLIPALHVSQMGDTFAPNSNSNDLQPVTTISGNVELDRASYRNRLTLNYLGGETFYAGDSRMDSSYQSLGLSDKIFGRRWSLLFSDNFVYSNQLGLGAGPMVGISVPAYTLAGLQPLYLIQQSFIIERTEALYNTSLGEVDYRLNARDSVTLTGSYGLLRFLEGGFIDTHQINGSFGYNRALNPHDTLSVTYSFLQFGFSVTDHTIDSQAFQLMYSRRVTGRLSLQLSGGPQLVSYFVGQNKTLNVQGYAQGTLLYRVRRTDFSVGYSHGLAGGAGVFQGSTSDSVSASVSRAVGRTWSLSSQFGYARNAALDGSGTFDSLYGGASARRPLGRYAATSFSYNVQHQTSSSGVCGASCGGNLLRHVFGVTFDWNFRPIRLE